MSSGSAERFLTAPTAEALKRRANDTVEFFRTRGPWIDVTFPKKNTVLDVQHRMVVTPNGYLPVLTVGGNIHAIDLTKWTPTVAYLQADADNTVARICFVVTNEVPVNA